MSGDLSSCSMFDLFRIEVDNQAATLNEALLELEQNPESAESLEILMRAAHSIKGAARIINFPSAVKVAHALEDCFVAAQNGKVVLGAQHFDILLRSIDKLVSLSQVEEAQIEAVAESQAAEINEIITSLLNIVSGTPQPKTSGSIEPAKASEVANPESISDTAPAPRDAEKKNITSQEITNPIIVTETATATAEAAVMEQKSDALLSARSEAEPLPLPEVPQGKTQSVQAANELQNKDEVSLKEEKAVSSETNPAAANRATARKAPATDRGIRINAENLNRLMGLAGEILVESRGVQSFSSFLLRLTRQQTMIGGIIEKLQESLKDQDIDDASIDFLQQIQQRVTDTRVNLADHLSKQENYVRRSTDLSQRLYREAIDSRMRPFSDGVEGLQRMVRDVSRSLGKEAQLKIVGLNTLVDRDILEKIKAPLDHLLRNAIDHGIEKPEVRLENNKPREGSIVLDARHKAGMLAITIRDDGAGVDTRRLKEAIIARKQVTEEMAKTLTEEELLEFLFLPKFTLKEEVTEISGRGVGLDVVLTAVQDLRGSIKTFSERGKGMRFQLMLPLTLSVVHSLMTEIAGEPYAFPLARIDRTIKLGKKDIRSLKDIHTLEGREYLTLEGEHIGLVAAHQVLGLPAKAGNEDELCILIVSDRAKRFALVVDRFLGECDVVVQPLDQRLGKVPDVSAATLTEQGTPALIIDIDDLVRSIDNLISGGRLSKREQAVAVASKTGKRILVVDDSFTVREVERKLLESKGYEVEVAVDGMDGWNAVRTGQYALVISDVDMPRMNGIEFVSHIKQDPNLKALPVMIVSYKDREQDRQRGLEAGANYYFSKGSFHDDTLLDAVVDMIGEP